MAGRWLSLSKVAEILGVHPSTIRNWADQGLLPVHRTQGGHRRFLRAEVDLWIQSQRADKPEENNTMMINALGYARIQIVEGHLENQGWYQKLDRHARQAYRDSGRKLMQGLMRYQSIEEDEEAHSEAHSLGVDYASIGRRYGLTVLEAVQAFMFFRNVVLDAAFHVYESASINSPVAWGGMFRRINDFTDRILMNLLETYEAVNGKDIES